MVPIGDDEKKFTELLDRVWGDALSRVCTNLRKVGLLLNDILAAARAITGEVNPFDLVAIEAVRRFYPEVYRSVRNHPSFVTSGENSLSSGRYMRDEQKKKKLLDFSET